MELILQNSAIVSIWYCADSWNLAIYGKQVHYFYHSMTCMMVKRV